MTDWYYRNGEDLEIGPFGSKQLLELIHNGDVVEQTLIRKDDSQWVAAIEVNGLWEAAARPTVEFLCPLCKRLVDPPPSRCKRCDIPVTKALERLIQHELGVKEKKSMLSNLLSHRKTPAEPPPPEPTPNHLDEEKHTENWASWVGDVLNRKNRRP